MKKILLTLAIVLTVVFSANAQDGFFRGGYDDSGDRSLGSGTTPLLPGYKVGETNDNQPGTVPLSSGLLVLTALGAGYAAARRKK